MTLVQRWKLWLGITYRCRCGAFVLTDDRKLHEEFHDIWYAPDAYSQGRTP